MCSNRNVLDHHVQQQGRPLPARVIKDVPVPARVIKDVPGPPCPTVPGPPWTTLPYRARTTFNEGFLPCSGGKPGPGRPKVAKVTKSVQNEQNRHFLDKSSRIVTLSRNDHFDALRAGVLARLFLGYSTPAGESGVSRGSDFCAKLDSQCVCTGVCDNSSKSGKSGPFRVIPLFDVRNVRNPASSTIIRH